MATSFLSLQQLASRKGFWSKTPTIVEFGFGSTLLLLFIVSIYFAFFYSFWCRTRIPLSVWHDAIYVSGFSLEGMSLPKHLRHPKCPAHRMEVWVRQCVRGCWLGSAPFFLLVPLPPLKRCHPRIAGIRCPVMSSWLCPSKQTAISCKSSEVSPPCLWLRQFSGVRFDRSGSATTAGWHGARRLARCGWHAVAGIERMQIWKMNGMWASPSTSTVVTKLQVTVSRDPPLLSSDASLPPASSESSCVFWHLR